MTARLARKLDQLQAGGTDKQILFLPVACGLGGQVTGRVQTLTLALALGRKAVFIGVDDAPYGQTFEPMHLPVALAGDLKALPLVDVTAEQDDPIVCYDPARVAVHARSLDAILLERIHRETGVLVPDRLALEGFLFNWMKPTAAMRAYCEEQQQRLGIGHDTLGIHFRRGDKAVETAFVPAAEFNRRIAAMHERWPFTSLFLASDSPDAPQEIVCPPGVKLIFDTEEQRYNNANHKMLLEAPELVDQETRVAFKNIYLLSCCGGLIGQDNAHFATLAGASILARDGVEERIELIDGRIAEKSSPALARYFRIKKALRAVARRLLPFMTMSARMERSAKRGQ
ncbi:hypothetical protein OLX02_10530 [Novosphingobium sp. KCTC 2891]|nr:hypothetical protein [Novosphingobium sp. KCTC 2891]